MDRRHQDESRSRHVSLARGLPAHFSGAGALVVAAGLAPSAAWAALALLLCLLFIGTLARRAPAAFILLAPLVVLRLSELASGVAIENGATMVETGVRGVPTGGFARLWLLDLVTMSAAAMLIESRWVGLRTRLLGGGPAWLRQAPALAAALTATLLMASAVLGWLAYHYGVPLAGQVDRFTYLNRLEGTPYRTIMMNRVIMAPLIGVVIAVPRTRRIGFCLIAWLLILSLLFGEKFTSLLFIIAAAAQPWALMALASTGALPLRALGLALTLLASISLPATLITYGALQSPARAWQRLADRAALQGQLWYLADRHGPPLRIDTPALRADVASWFRPGAQRAELAGARFGLYYVMARFTPSHRLTSAIRAKNGFVFAFHPYLLLAGGAVVLVAGAVLVSMFQALALLLLAHALAGRRWLATIAFGRVLSSVYACVITGYLWNVLGIKTLLTLAVGGALLAAPRLIHFGNKQRVLTKI